MPELLKKIVQLFEYKEPKSKELGFELLEPENNNDAPSQPDDHDKNQSDNQGDGDGRTTSGRRKSRENSGRGLKKSEKQTISKSNSDKQTQDADSLDEAVPDDKNNNTQKDQDSDRKARLVPVSIQNRDKKQSSRGEKDANRVCADLAENLETVKQKFLVPKNQDVIIREFNIGRKVRAFMVYLDGMSAQQTLNLVILPTLMSKDACDGLSEKATVDYLIENVLPVHGIKKANSFNDIILQVLGGVSALFVDGCEECILLETRGYDKRSVESPKTETVVRGPQEGFTEDLRTNITLIRRIVKNENLVTEMMLIGTTSHENCAVLYVDGIANMQVVEEVKKRLKSIKAGLVLGDGMIEQLIEDNTFMLFPQLISTERPDRTASFLMEGQVVIISNGSPFALAAPITFFRLFHTSEDMAVRWPTSNFLRLIRLFGLFCATFLPGLYVAITLYHIEMIPTELLLSIARSKEQVPFPTILEVLMMEVAFELIREGGIRVPSVIGQTLGIVGALILGQAAVSAGLVSPMLVIVVSITGLGSFAIPNYSLSLTVRIVRFAFIFAGALLGFYGLSLMGIVLITLACSMKSFGVPYFAPVAPKTKESRDVIFRQPLWSLNYKPDMMNTPGSNFTGGNKGLWIRKSSRKGDQSDQ